MVLASCRRSISRGLVVRPPFRVPRLIYLGVRSVLADYSPNSGACFASWQDTPCCWVMVSAPSLTAHTHCEDPNRLTTLLRHRLQAFIPRDKKGGTPVCNQTTAARLDRREHERHHNALRHARSLCDYSSPPPSVIGDDRVAAMRRHSRLIAIEDGNARLLHKAPAPPLRLPSPFPLVLPPALPLPRPLTLTNGPPNPSLDRYLTVWPRSRE
jgi:hypothetical protein